MNSSLLVPALIVVAFTAGIFVFGDSLFSGGSSEDANNNKYTVNQTEQKNADVVDVKASTSSASVGSDFSWDEEDTTEPAQSPITKPTESFVSTKQSEDAPGALYGSDDNSQTDTSFGSADDFASADLDLSNDSSDFGDADDFEPALDSKVASKQVDEDLKDFFSLSPKSTDSSSATTRSSVNKSVKTPSAPTKKSVGKSDFDVALASPKTSELSVDAFEDLDSGESDFTPASRAKASDMKSVVASEPKKAAATQSAVTSKDAAADSVISGALEPMKGDDQSAFGGSKSSVSLKTPARKFKITNPKETTLAVTMSVDGKQVTLKPDQSYVIQESDGDVEVMFSRGGSFGFETKTLKKGHYRFSVSREAGWKLVN